MRYILCTLLLITIGCQDQFIFRKKDFDERNRSLFTSYSGQYCDVLDFFENPISKINCENLKSFADNNKTECEVETSTPSYARFPGQDKLMHLCNNNLETLNLKNREKIRFAILGDLGVGEDPSKGYHQGRVAQALYAICPPANKTTPETLHLSCDFAYLLGDLIYPSGVTSVFDSGLTNRFENIYKDFEDMIFFAIPGNHDYEGSVQAQIDYSYFSKNWRMLDFYYKLPNLPDWLNIYGSDTSGMLSLGSNSNFNEQKEDIKNTFCNSKGWRIFSGHHPNYSNGKYGFNYEIQQRLDSIYRDCPFDIYLAGHEHHQEHISTETFDIIIQGGGGTDLREVPIKESSDIIEINEKSYNYTQEYAKSAHGFAVIEATRERLDIFFYDIKQWDYDSENREFSSNILQEDYIYHCEMTKDTKGCKAITKKRSKLRKPSKKINYGFNIFHNFLIKFL